MRETIHLIPKALRDKVAAHQKAVAAGKAAPESLVLTDADFGMMSGRVVVLRELSIPDMEKADRYAYQRVKDSTVGIEFEAYRQDGRMRMMVVAVSAPRTDPRESRTAKLIQITDADREGASMEPGEDGHGKNTGRSFEELFTVKDLAVLRSWDRRHHSATQEDVDAILGEAIPTGDD